MKWDLNLRPKEDFLGFKGKLRKYQGIFKSREKSWQVQENWSKKLEQKQDQKRDGTRFPEG